MAGEWLKFDASTPEKPEVLAITLAMGWDDPDLTVGKLLRVWRWFDQQTVNGNAPSVTTSLLDRLLNVPGLCKAMEVVGWLIVNESGLSLPNFDRHNGKTAKDRALTAKRVANHKTNAKGNANSVSDALPREEKRREEKIEEIQEPTVLPVSANAEPADDTVIRLPDRRIPCPADRLLEAFHTECPTLPRVMKINDKRKAHLTARWREVDQDSKFESTDDGLEVFRGIFQKIHASDFLAGRAKAWHATFDWVMESSTNFLKVCEGHYDNDRRLKK